MNINTVGIDISKGKSMIVILRPCGKIVACTFEIRHTFAEIN